MYHSSLLISRNVGIDHSFFTEGKELVLTLGKNESSWGTKVADLPPSLSEYTGFNGTTNGTIGETLRRWESRANLGSMKRGNFGGVGQEMV